MPDRYPQGGELQIIKAVTGREIRKGSIPSDHGIIVNNIGTLWAMQRAIFRGLPYTERILTISGNGSAKQGNYCVKIGTPIAHLLKHSQDRSEYDSLSVIVGGAMMGKFADNLSTPIHKGAGGLLLLESKDYTESNCIKCGDCVTVCPQRLMPLEFVRHQHDTKALQDFHLHDCIECGACAYICPSDVPLMQGIFEGKKTRLA